MKYNNLLIKLRALAFQEKYTDSPKFNRVLHKVKARTIAAYPPKPVSSYHVMYACT